MVRLLGPIPAADNTTLGATTSWVTAFFNLSAWKPTGNAGTNPAIHFVGTTDNQPVHFRVNSVDHMMLDTNGCLRIGNPTVAGISGSERLILNDNTGSFSDYSFAVAGGGWPVINLGSSNGTPTARTPSTVGGNMGTYNWWGYDGAAWLSIAQLNVKTLTVASGAITAEADWSINGSTVLVMTSTGVSLLGASTSVTPTTADNSTRIATTAFVKAQSYLVGNQTITFTGDATGSGATSVALTLAASGVTAGTYQAVTVDAKGRVTAGSNPTTLTGYGITDAAPLLSPGFTGVPTAPTAAADTSTAQLATTAFVVGQGYLKASAATSTYAPLVSPALTGTPTAPTAAVDTSTAQLATTAFVVGQGYLKSASATATYAPLASPALTGTPTAPTAAVGTNTTQVATTAFVLANQDYSLTSIFQAGLIGAQESWYPAGMVVPTATTTLALTAGRMYAMPFYLPHPQVVDRLAFNVTTQSSGQNARVGIYSTSSPSLYPTTLVYDSGNISTTGTGVKNNTAISVTLPAGLYWFVILASSTPTVVAYAGTSGAPIFGYSNTLSGAAQVGLYVAQAFGALPASFPSGATMLNNTFPAVFSRFSS